MRQRRIRYSADELAFVSERRTMRRRALHALFVAAFGRHDVTVDHLKSLCTRSGWLVGRRPWRPEDDAQLRALYPDRSTADVARELGRSVSSVYGRAQQFGLCKSAAYLESPAACRLRRGDNVGAAYRFAKGHAPANKGKRMPFHPNSAAHRFKPGQRPPNATPVGHERVDEDGYVWIKVDEPNPHTGYRGHYVFKHKRRWEDAHGPVPSGYALKCLDGNKQNTDPSNWELIHRAVLPRLNGRWRDYDRAPAELRPTILALAKLEQAVATKQPRAARRRRRQHRCVTCPTMLTGRVRKCGLCKASDDRAVAARRGAESGILNEEHVA